MKGEEKKIGKLALRGPTIFTHNFKIIFFDNWGDFLKKFRKGITSVEHISKYGRFCVEIGFQDKQEKSHFNC